MKKAILLIGLLTVTIVLSGCVDFTTPDNSNCDNPPDIHILYNYEAGQVIESFKAFRTDFESFI